MKQIYECLFQTLQVNHIINKILKEKNITSNIWPNLTLSFPHTQKKEIEVWNFEN